MRPVLLCSLLLASSLIAGCSTNGAAAKPVNTIVATQQNYNARGTASYYGPGFDGKKTANGETFRKDAMTAAHKDLPFNTKVRVMNLKNGKWVVVRINDRFGGKKGRIIDLSEGAFKQIADLKEGVINVEVKQVGN
ncbi:MAG TPA: septal ring lytic transglycosylase RlpA family protein [Candidatus Sumerlaeota bacterium]|nr:septal ring lytic transglycosylase RlpA family protein [Candidatus Sumerlaeota bacterium]HNM45400.1 septal ring lytic transglycosylase RlpA family protein [Candidatus Sumerlaeota bacterium]